MKLSMVRLVGLLLLGIFGYQVNVGELGNQINTHLLEKVILREIEAAPDNPNLYTDLGDIYYTAENWSGSRDAWEKSLA